mgnify:CR=1 FL=1|jgi:hypothetical protein
MNSRFIEEATDKVLETLLGFQERDKNLIDESDPENPVPFVNLHYSPTYIARNIDKDRETYGNIGDKDVVTILDEQSRSGKVSRIPIFSGENAGLRTAYRIL